MPKARSNPAQLGFVFDPPSAAVEPAALAGFERQISRAVAQMLKEDERSREFIAAAMGELLDEDISRYMLDAYASAARPEHKVIASRFLALVAVTGRYDLLDRVLRHVGAAVLVGEEVHTARLGQIDRQISALQSERKRVAAMAPLIREGKDA